MNENRFLWGELLRRGQSAGIFYAPTHAYFLQLRPIEGPSSSKHHVLLHFLVQYGEPGHLRPEVLVVADVFDDDLDNALEHAFEALESSDLPLDVLRVPFEVES